jgi:hypothetical protein
LSWDSLEILLNRNRYVILVSGYQLLWGCFLRLVVLMLMIVEEQFRGLGYEEFYYNKGIAA